MGFLVATRRRRKALGEISEYTVTSSSGTTGPRRARGSLGSLGADEPEMSEAQWRAAMLAKQTEVTEWQERWVKRDELQRWLQIAATLSIPLAAAIWKLIFKGASEK